MTSPINKWVIIEGRSEQIEESKGNKTRRIHFNDLPQEAGTLFDVACSKIEPDSFIGTLMQITGKWIYLDIGDQKGVLVNVNSVAKRLGIAPKQLAEAKAKWDITEVVKTRINELSTKFSDTTQYIQRLRGGFTADQIQRINAAIKSLETKKEGYYSKKTAIKASPFSISKVIDGNNREQYYIHVKTLRGDKESKEKLLIEWSSLQKLIRKVPNYLISGYEREKLFQMRLENFEKTRQLVEELGPHEGIISVRKIGKFGNLKPEDNGYLVEHLPCTLANLAKKDLSIDCKVTLMRQVAEGLAHLHSKGYVHGNLTLKNICGQLDPSDEDTGIAKISNFNHARKISYEREELSDVREFGKILKTFIHRKPLKNPTPQTNQKEKDLDHLADRALSNHPPTMKEIANELKLFEQTF